MNSLEVMEPSACTWCGIAQRGHAQQYAPAVGWHKWAAPSGEQILARMKARRLALTVAREGALPVPVLPEPQASDVAVEQLDFLHRVTLPDLRREVQHHQDGKARWRKRAEVAEARVAELKAERADEHDELALALGRDGGSEWADLIESAAGAVGVEAKWERHRAELTALRNDALNMRGVLSPNGEARKVPMPLGETLTPAVEWLVARIAELEAERRDGVEDGCACPPADRPHQVGCPLVEVPLPGVGPDSPEMRSLREALTGSPDRLTSTFAPVASLREPDGEHYQHVHHSYRVPHDLPETGGEHR